MDKKRRGAGYMNAGKEETSMAITSSSDDDLKELEKARIASLDAALYRQERLQAKFDNNSDHFISRTKTGGDPTGSYNETDQVLQVAALSRAASKMQANNNSNKGIHVSNAQSSSRPVSVPGSFAVFPTGYTESPLPSPSPLPEYSPSPSPEPELYSSQLFQAELIDPESQAKELEAVRRQAVHEVTQNAAKAEIYDDSDERKQRKRSFICLIIMTVVGIIAAVTIGVTVGKNQSSTTIIVEARNLTREEIIANAIASQFGNVETLEDENSAQYAAANWMAVNDTIIEYPLESDSSLEAFAQRYVMCLLAFATDVDGWTVQSKWLEPEPECTWSGVSCDGMGNIRGLSLRHINLNGTLPTEMGTLTNLKFMFVHGNPLLGGTIPTEFGNMKSLVSFYGHKNSFYGSLPEEFGHLSNLEKLSLSNNNLAGTLSQEHGRMLELEYLDLSFNRLRGEIPTDFWRMHSVETVLLNDNQLTGKVPKSFVGMTETRRLELQNNLLTGPIPASLGTLLNLHTARFQGNTFTGSMPESMCSLRESVPYAGLNLLEASCNANFSCDCCTRCF